MSSRGHTKEEAATREGRVSVTHLVGVTKYLKVLTVWGSSCSSCPERLGGWSVRLMITLYPQSTSTERGLLSAVLCFLSNREPQTVGQGCHMQSGPSSLLSLNFLETPWWPHPEVYFDVDSKSSKVDQINHPQVHTLSRSHLTKFPPRQLHTQTH